MTCTGCGATCVAFYTHTTTVHRRTVTYECAHCIQPNDLSAAPRGVIVRDVTRQSQRIHSSARNAEILAGQSGARTGDLFDGARE